MSPEPMSTEHMSTEPVSTEPVSPVQLSTEPVSPVPVSAEPVSPETVSTDTVPRALLLSEPSSPDLLSRSTIVVSSSGDLDDAAPTGERLQKVLARIGLGSRRVCVELIADGRVTVNGVQAKLGRRVEVGSDCVALDGVELATNPALVHYLVNKPAGMVCSTTDPAGRPLAIDIVPREPRVFTVGRLDADSEGLLVLTNDGSLAYRLTHPSFGVEKEYLAEVSGQPSPGALARLRQGVELTDGVTAPAKVGVMAPGVLRIVVHEGRKRQVRRMCDAVGYPVIRLVRVRIGPISDHTLAPGQWRQLSNDEVRSLSGAARPRDTDPVAGTRRQSGANRVARR